MKQASLLVTHKDARMLRDLLNADITRLKISMDRISPGRTSNIARIQAKIDQRKAIAEELDRMLHGKVNTWTEIEDQ